MSRDNAPPTSSETERLADVGCRRKPPMKPAAPFRPEDLERLRRGIEHSLKESFRQDLEQP